MTYSFSPLYSLTGHIDLGIWHSVFLELFLLDANSHWMTGSGDTCHSSLPLLGEGSIPRSLTPFTLLFFVVLLTVTGWWSGDTCCTMSFLNGRWVNYSWLNALVIILLSESYVLQMYSEVASPLSSSVYQLHVPIKSSKRENKSFKKKVL